MKTKITILIAAMLICMFSAVSVEARGHGDVQTIATTKIYATQNTSSRVVTTVPKGDVVTIGGFMNDYWYYVFYLGKSGYIQKANTKPFPASTTKYAKTALTLRKTASDKAVSVAKIAKGDKVKALTTNGSWSFLEYKGMYYGWVRSSSLSATAPKASKNTTQTAKTINLTATSPVPSYMKYLKYNGNALTGLNSRQKKFAKMLLNTLQKSGDKQIVDLGNTWKLSSKEASEIKSVLSSIYFPFSGEIHFMKQETKTGTQWRLYAGHSRSFVKKNDTYIQKCKKIAKPYVKSGMSTRQKVVAIEKAVRKHMTYKENYHDVTKAITTGKGVCQCYARIFQGACLAYNIPCKYVSGKANGNGSWERHAWNRVLIGSTWYYIDPTWDDTTGSNDYQLSKKLWNDHKA